MNKKSENFCAINFSIKMYLCNIGCKHGTFPVEFYRWLCPTQDSTSQHNQDKMRQEETRLYF